MFKACQRLILRPSPKVEKDTVISFIPLVHLPGHLLMRGHGFAVSPTHSDVSLYSFELFFTFTVLPPTITPIFAPFLPSNLLLVLLNIHQETYREHSSLVWVADLDPPIKLSIFCTCFQGLLPLHT